jgi:hypothetical protein
MDWLGVLAIVVPTIAAIILGVPPLRAALKDIKKSPKLTVSLNGASERSLVYVVDVQNHEGVMAEFQVRIANEGTEAARNVFVRVDVPSLIYVTDGVERQTSEVAKIMHYEQAAEDIRDTKRVLLVARFPVVQQRTSHSLVDAFTFFLDSTALRKIDATTKDNVPVELEYEIRHSFRVRLEVICDNHDPLTCEHTIQFYRLGSRELVHAFAKEETVHALIPKKADGSFLTGEAARVFVLKRDTLMFEDGKLKLWYAKLAGAKVQLATYFDRVGYLPVTASSRSVEGDDGAYIDSWGTGLKVGITSIRRTDVHGTRDR